jgi:CDP-glucose 4,6-dehydratase
LFNNFYQDKRILVTGAAGVKGTWLCLALLEAGAEVVGVDIRAPGPQSNFVASGLGSRIQLHRGDVNDLALMRKLVDETDAIFHLAARALVREAHRNPLDAYRANVLGVATVLESIRLSARPRRLVAITTDKVYAPKNSLWVETDALGATGPYSVSKACAEMVLADYQRTYFKAAGHLLAIARAGNVLIGGDLHSSRTTEGAGRIFVDCYEALAEGRAPEIFRPGFTRPYIYGLDIISGYMTLMSKIHEDGIAGEPFNFGPYEQFGVSNALLATKICELWGGKIMWQGGEPREEPFEFQALSSDKSRQRLSWRPAFTLFEALQAATHWYKAWAAQRAGFREGCLYDVNRELLQSHRASAQRLGIDWASEAAVSPPPSAASAN